MKQLLILCGALLLTVSACNKRNRSDANCYNTAFESHVVNGNFGQIPSSMQTFVASISNSQSDSAKMQKIAKWLNCQPVVSSANILCISCIETLPEQSEINFTVQHNGQDTTLVLDILMSNPLSVANIH